jgi:hypothetical protein
MARIDVDIDVDDMLWDMNRHERQEMADKLYDDGIIPSELQDMADELDSRLPETNLEQELSRLLDAVWDNRMFITEEHKEVLRIIAKKGL